MLFCTRVHRLHGGVCVCLFVFVCVACNVVGVYQGLNICVVCVILCVVQHGVTWCVVCIMLVRCLYRVHDEYVLCLFSAFDVPASALAL